MSGGPGDWSKAGSNGTTLAVYWVEKGTHTDDAPDSCCKKNTTGCGTDQTPNKEDKLWSKVRSSNMFSFTATGRGDLLSSVNAVVFPLSFTQRFIMIMLLFTL